MVRQKKKAAEGHDIYTHDGHMASFVHTYLQVRNARYANGLCIRAGCTATVPRNTTQNYFKKLLTSSMGWNRNTSLGHAQTLCMQNNT